MKKEDFISLGVDEEVAKKCESASIEELKGYVPYDRFKEIVDEKNKFKSDLKERDVQFETLKNSKGDIEAMKKQIEDLQKDNKVKGEAYANEIRTLKINNAIETALSNAKAKNIKAVKALLKNMDKAELLEDGTIKGLNDQIKALQKSDSYLFEEKSSAPHIKGAQPRKVTESKSNLDNQLKTINEEIENLKQNSNSNTLDETTFKTFQNFINEQIEEIKNSVNILDKQVSDSALTRIKAIAGNCRFIQPGETYKYQSPPIEIKNDSIEKWDFVKEEASIFEKSMSFNPIIESDGTISKFEVSESCILIYNIILNISSINKNRNIVINLTMHDHHFEINRPTCKTNYTFSGILILNKGDTLKPQIIIGNNGIETVENLTLSLSLTKLVTNFVEETKQMIMQ